MISNTRTAAQVVEDNLPGERRAFSIKATGKAFRTLVDGLYENKIGAVVRELMANAWDSHAAAGHPDLSIHVTAPTELDPTFRVRDFGVSMTHDQIMDLYTTLFDSTKGETNEQVGMFGLGSKSPFAYTDTFSVTAWLDGEKRVYVAHIADDDLPMITHLTTEDQGVDVQGIEVAIPVKNDFYDVRQFQTEIRKMIFASDTPPDVDGFDFEAPEVALDLDGVKVLRKVAGLFGHDPVLIRQGCVIYPYSTSEPTGLTYSYQLLVDVPIGTADVTASRESLSLDDHTREAVEQAIQNAKLAISDYVEEVRQGFVNRLDEYRSYTKFDFLTHGVGRQSIKLTPDMPNPNVPAQTISQMVSARKLGARTHFSEIREAVFLVSRPGQKVPRSNLRIQAFFKANRYSRRIYRVSSEELPRLVRILGLTPEQIKPVASLPDVEVTRAPRDPSSGNTKGPSAAPSKLPKGKYWLPKHGAFSMSFEICGVRMVNTNDIGYDTEHVISSGWNTIKRPGIRPFLDFVGLDPSDVVFFTDKQVERLGVPESRRLDNEIDRRIKALKAADVENIQDALDHFQCYGVVSSSFDILKPVARALGIPNYNTWNHNPFVEGIAERINEELQSKVPTIKKALPAVVVDYAATILGLKPKNLLTTQVIDDTINDMITDEMRDLTVSGDAIGNLIRGLFKED